MGNYLICKDKIMLKKYLAKIITAIIPGKKLRKKIRRKIKGTASASYPLYYPCYNPVVIPDGTEPEIYNKHGDRVRVFFMRDVHMAHAQSMRSNYILWDRFNIGLDVHFYTHNAMLETMGKPTYRYGYLIESPGIVPKDYKIFEKNEGLHKDFYLIFTYDEKILNKYDNARFVPFAGAPTLLGIPESEYLKKYDLYLNKTRNIMMVSSDKVFCELHKIRLNTAVHLKNNPNVDTYGTFDGGGYVDNMYDLLSCYRYAIMFENFVGNDYFSERLTNCFVTQTVPIYIGTKNIGKYFNIDGIIHINPEDTEHIDKILTQCSLYDYEQRLPAIKDNFNRVQMYRNIEDTMYLKYIKGNINTWI